MGSDTGKAPQRVNVWIWHMHREHSAYTNPTCALCAPFVSHTSHFCFDLCRARAVNPKTANKRRSLLPLYPTEEERVGGAFGET